MLSQGKGRVHWERVGLQKIIYSFGVIAKNVTWSHICICRFHSKNKKTIWKTISMVKISAHFDA